MTSNLVPFGKYKGQPVEALIADSTYCDWLAAQPWFRDRFGGIYQIIIQGPQSAAAETPEHNEMQAWFLDDAACMHLAELVDPTFDHAGPVALWQVRVEVMADAVDRAARRHPECFEIKRTAPGIGRRVFEYRGWDVAFVAHSVAHEVRRVAATPCGCPGGVPHEMPRLAHAPPQSERRSHLPPDCLVDCSLGGFGGDRDIFRAVGSIAKMLVECKPRLGDDFPAVLRQVLGYAAGRDDSRVVVVRDFAFERVSWAQVVEMFRTAGVALVHMPALPPPAILAASASG